MKALKIVSAVVGVAAITAIVAKLVYDKMDTDCNLEIIEDCDCCHGDEEALEE